MNYLYGFSLLLSLNIAFLKDSGAVEGGSNAIESRQFFDLPELPLRQAILEFAFQANCEIVAREEDIKNLRSAAIFGYQAPTDALQKILANSDLVSEFNSISKVYVVRKTPQAKVETSQIQPIVPVEEVIVTGFRFPMRYQTIINTESRYGNAIFDSSRAHNILPYTVLKDAGSDNLVEAMKYISSSTQGDGFMASNDDYFIRGFPRQNTYINGLRISKNTAMQIMPDNVEHIDVLKGPTMLFYGQSSAGGVVDVARRQPTAEDSVDVEVLAGQFGRHKIRARGNKGDIGIFGINLLVSAIDDMSFDSVDADQTHRQSFSSRIAGNWADRLALNLGYEYQNLSKSTAANLPMIGENGEFLPYRGSQFINQAHDDFDAVIEAYDGSFSLNLNPLWRIQGAFQYQRETHAGVRTKGEFLADSHILLLKDNTKRDDKRKGVATIIGQLAAPIVRKDYNYRFSVLESIFDQFERQLSYTSSVDLNGRFEIGGIEQQVILGVDIYEEALRQEFAIEEREFLRPQTYSSAIFLSPNEELRRAMLDDPPVTTGIKPSSWRINREDWGAFGQLKTSWTSSWSTSIGGRYSRFYDTRRQVGGTASDLEGRYEDWILQVGSSFQVQDHLSLYANYAETLNLNYLVDDWNLFVERPEKSRQQEIGIKWDGFDGKALGTISLFNIKSSNISSIQFDEGYRELMEPQERVAQGVEIDFTIRAADWLELIASASVARNHITQENHPELLYPRLVADNTAGLFSRISFPNQWASFVGINYVSDRSVDGSSLTIGESVDVDVAVAKQFGEAKNWSARASVKNLLDSYKPASAIPNSRVSPNQGRRAALSVEYKM